MKIRGLLFACGVVVVGYLLGYTAISSWRRSAPTVESIAVSQSHIFVHDVQLGSLKPMESVSFEVRLDNQSETQVRLLQPKSGCGCITVNQGPIVIAPRQSISIPFRFRAGSHPERFAREIVFSSQNKPDISWPAKVSGEVVSDVWCKPDRVDLQYRGKEAGKMLTGEFIIYCKMGKSLNRVSANGDHISARADRLSSEEWKVTVLIDTSAQPEGNALISCIGDNGDTLQLVPLFWAKSPDLRWFPEKCRISRSQGDGKQTIIVRFGPDNSGGRWSMQSIVPWLTVESWQPNSVAGTAVLRYRADQVPPKYNGFILQLVNDQSSTVHRYSAIVED